MKSPFAYTIAGLYKEHPSQNLYWQLLS